MNIKKIFTVLVILSGFTFLWGKIPDFSGIRISEKAEQVLKEMENLPAEQWEVFFDKQIKEAGTPEDRFVFSVKKAVFLETRGEYKKAAEAYYDAAFAGSNRNDLCLVFAAKNILQEGDFKTAREYLDPVLLTSGNQEILAYGRFISALVILNENQKEGIKLLKTYSGSQEMKDFEPAILFLLWYIDDDKESAARLTENYPQSPEAQIIKGNSQIMASSFWYFMPRKTVTALKAPEKPGKTAEKDFFKDKSKTAGSKNDIEETVSSQGRDSGTESKKVVFRQTGFFKNKDYAEALETELIEKGFDARIRETKRQSGNVYYAVIIPEDPDDQQQIENKLKNLGYESAPLFE